MVEPVGEEVDDRFEEPTERREPVADPPQHPFEGLGDLFRSEPAGFDDVFYPGEIEARAADRNAEHGLDFPVETLAGLRRVATQTGIALDIFR